MAADPQKPQKFNPTKVKAYMVVHTYNPCHHNCNKVQSCSSYYPSSQLQQTWVTSHWRVLRLEHHQLQLLSLIRFSIILCNWTVSDHPLPWGPKLHSIHMYIYGMVHLRSLISPEPYWPGLIRMAWSIRCSVSKVLVLSTYYSFKICKNIKYCTIYILVCRHVHNCTCWQH